MGQYDELGGSREGSGRQRSWRRIAVAVFIAMCVVVASTAIALTVGHHNSGRASPSSSGEIVVDVPQLGKLRGNTSAGTSVASFKGIPFGMPPTGHRRWQAPQAFGSWGTGVRNATQFGARCAQNFNPPTFPPGAEDCLFLNVYTPAEALRHRATLPVMVWIYGGGYWSGESNDYDGVSLVNASGNSVVVVTLNYRVGPFGFLASPALKAWSLDSSVGNFGIQDQRLAIQWVRDHVAAFGGDGNAITIFGQSAGGNSVINHLAAPRSAGLFRAAIIESGAYDTGAQSLSTATHNYNKLINATQCTTPACLSGKSTQEILNAFTLKPSADNWGPVVDGVELTAAPTDLITQGRYNSNVSVMLGSNRDEWASWDISATPHNLTEAGYDALINDTGWNTTQLSALKQVYAFGGNYPYPTQLGPYSDWWWTYMRVKTDTVPGLGACGVRWLARLLVAGGTPSVHTYLFAQPTVCDLARGGATTCYMMTLFVPGIQIGVGNAFTVPHGVEQSYVFATTSWMPLGSQTNLALSTSTYWCSFAKSGGNPNAPGLPNWPPYDATTDVTQRFEEPSANDTGIRQQPRVREQACNWQTDNPIPNAPE